MSLVTTTTQFASDAATTARCGGLAALAWAIAIFATEAPGAGRGAFSKD